MAIRKIMEEESALKIIDDIKNKICDVDLDDICGEKTDVQSQREEVYKKLKQGVMCGLVYWDEDNGCLSQVLIKPVESGTMKADRLQYRSKITLGDAKSFRSGNETEHGINALAHITGKATQLIEKLSGQDMLIALGCMSFFDK